ncbi:hypothetical protein, partial [Sphingomonas sp. PP-CE-3G-477]|uniref:hypothetical protein n=1 Tax=Sphingomonas sp. PP-CE-3G-477 TaxID=2135660 RepID=UPI001C629665
NNAQAHHPGKYVAQSRPQMDREARLITTDTLEGSLVAADDAPGYEEATGAVATEASLAVERTTEFVDSTVEELPHAHGRRASGRMRQNARIIYKLHKRTTLIPLASGCEAMHNLGNVSIFFSGYQQAWSVWSTVDLAYKRNVIATSVVQI